MDRRMKRCALALVLLAAVMILPAIAGGTSAQTAFAAENVSVGLMEDGAFKAKDSMDLGTIDLSKLDPQGASGPIEFRLAIRYTTAIELSDFLKISFEFYGQSPVDNAFRLRSDVVSGSTTNKTAQAFIYFDPSGLTAGTYHGQLGAHLPFDEVTPNSSAYTFNSGILTIPISITLTGENPYLTPKVKKITAKAGNDRAEISWTPVDTCTNYSVFRREGTDENTSLPELDNYIYLGNVRTMSEGDGNGFSDPVYVDYYAQNGKTYSYIVISDGSSSPFSGDASRSVSVSPKASIRLKPAAPLASASSGGQDEIGLTWYWDAHGVQRDPATNEEDELTGNGQDQGEDLVDHFNVYSNGTLVRQVRRNAVKKLGSGYYNWQVSLPAEQEETEYTLWVTAVAPDGTEGYASNKVIAYTTKEWDLSIEGHTVRYIDEDGHSGLSIDIPATGVDRFEYWRKPVSAD
ncbi:MAG: hypothetical protein IJ109_10400, partial [Firmicutes bacterium]|nr:hypothetical protein [Bacillota bacterium]